MWRLRREDSKKDLPQSGHVHVKSLRPCAMAALRLSASCASADVNSSCLDVSWRSSSVTHRCTVRTSPPTRVTCTARRSHLRGFRWSTTRLQVAGGVTLSRGFRSDGPARSGG